MVLVLGQVKRLELFPSQPNTFSTCRYDDQVKAPGARDNDCSNNSSKKKKKKKEKTETKDEKQQEQKHDQQEDQQEEQIEKTNNNNKNEKKKKNNNNQDDVSINAFNFCLHALKLPTSNRKEMKWVSLSW